jgi:ribosomal protein S6--L-glutamate ligase
VVGGVITEEAEVRKDKIKVLVFSGYSTENEGNLMKTAGRIKEECEKAGVECFVAFVPFARAVKNQDGTRTIINKDGKEFVANRHDTVVVVRGAAAGNSGTLDMISSFEKDGFFVINSRETIEICSDKYRTALTLVEAGLPTPRTALITDPDEILETHKQIGGAYPVVVKTIRGSKGKGVFILESEQSLKSTIDAMMKIDEDQELIMQEYLKINGDLRVIVLDGKIVGVMERGKVNGDFRTNFSLGASIKGKTISDEIKKLALRASKAVGGYFTGVDICVTKGTRKPFIIEINSSPGSEGIEKASSKNVTQIFVNHIIDKKNWDYPPTIVGRREMVNIEGVGPVQAKFDTGNMVVNSIHAEDIKVNGKTVTWKHGGKTFKNKIIDELIVLQGAIAANREKRVMIELDMEFLGKNYQKRRFTLDDRSNKGTPVLIGVPFMKEFHIIVDPGKRFIKTEKLDERKMTDAEMDKREKIVKKLKRKKDEFESRYGKDAKSVMYATATKLAMGEEESDSEKDERLHKGDLEGTTARRKKYARYTPGQVNELADTYFKGEL